MCRLFYISGTVVPRHKLSFYPIIMLVHKNRDFIIFSSFNRRRKLDFWFFTYPFINQG